MSFLEDYERNARLSETVRQAVTKMRYEDREALCLNCPELVRHEGGSGSPERYECGSLWCKQPGVVVR
jgi:hypothetical protein